MNGIELFSIWAPADSIWSIWAKPVLFAETDFESPSQNRDLAWPKSDLKNNESTAVVVDLPGGESVQIGIGLAQEGYRPVPLYNSASTGT